MKRLTIAFLLVLAAIILPCSAATYDIICNVDGADCYIDDKYIGQIYANHLYYTGNLGTDSKYHTLYVKSENSSTSMSLPDSWDDFSHQRIVVYLESGIYPPMGTLNIYTIPEEAIIYFQEDYLGKGPYKELGTTKEGVPYSLTTYQGYHRIKIWKDGYDAISERIFVYGSDEFDTCYYLEKIGEHSEKPFLGPEPTPAPAPTPTPEIIIQEKEVIKEIKVIETVEVEVMPSITVIILGLIIGGIGGIFIYIKRDELPKINLPKLKRKSNDKKRNKDYWDD